MKRTNNQSHPSAGASPASSPSTARLSLGKKLVFAVVTVTVLLLLLEGVLALLGVKPQLYDRDPYVGFSTQIPLFVESRNAAGEPVMATARNRLEFFNPQQFAKVKAAGTYRIFSMGGSTTYGHPYSDPTSFNGWLREFLMAMVPQRKFEVINAGGISYGSYRVAQLMEELIHYKPDLFLIYCGHNEFLERRIYGQVNRTPRAFQGLAGWAWHLRSATALQRVVAPIRRLDRAEAAAQNVLASDPVTMLDNSLGPTAYQRDDNQREQTFQHYQFNLRRMIDIARSVGAKVIFVTPASNYREVSPFKSEHRTGLSDEDRRRWKELYDAARADFTNPVPGHALESLAAAEKIDDRAANLYFVRGRVLEKLSRFEEAKAAYQRAIDEDVCPLRGPSQIRRILAEVTQERHVPLVDFQSFVESKSEHSIPGASLFLDHVHPTIDGYRLLALELLKAMEQEHLVTPNWDPSLIQKTTQAVLGRIDLRAHSLALMNLCKTLGWAGKREEAYRAGVRATEIGGGIAEVQYQTGLAAQLSGRTNEALGFYQAAVGLQPDLAEAHCALGVVLEDTGRLTDALREYQLARKFSKPKNIQRDEANVSRVGAKLGGATGRVSP